MSFRDRDAKDDFKRVPDPFFAALAAYLGDRTPDPLTTSLSAFLKGEEREARTLTREPVRQGVNLPDNDPRKRQGVSQIAPPPPQSRKEEKGDGGMVDRENLSRAPAGGTKPHETPPPSSKRLSVSWKQTTAFLVLLTGASLFALAEEFLNSQFYQAWVFSHPIYIVLAGVFGGITIAGIYKSVRRTPKR